MVVVGLKHLKTHLSEYVRRSEGGERIVITDRGREVAELTPLSDARKAMAKLRDEGTVEWGGGKPSGVRGLEVRGEPVSKTVLDDRR